MKRDNGKIIKKIRGLLAIAKDEKNDEESQSAFILAQKLMIQYEIDSSEVGDFIPQDEDVDEEFVTVYKKLFWWERELAIIVAKNFRVKNFIKSKRQGGERVKRRIVFLGFGRDLELAKEMYILAYDALLYHSKQFVEDYYSDFWGYRDSYTTNSLKQSYIRGFLEGLVKRFDEQIAVLRESYEMLVLIPEEVEKVYSNMFKNSKPLAYTKPQAEVAEAYQKGFEDGNKMDFTKSTLSDGSED